MLVCLTMRYFFYSPTTHFVQLALNDVGFLKAHLSTSLSPSTSAPHLGYRLEFILSTWRLAWLNGNFSCWQSWEFINVPWSSDLQVARHQHIYSHFARCTWVPWHSLTSLVSYLALVNDIHQWLVIQWFLFMLDLEKYIHRIRTVPLGFVVGED